MLATDGFIVYDIQDEAGRTTVERPFPFKKTLDASWYASLFLQNTGKHCVVYKSVVEDSLNGFDGWIDEAVNKYGHHCFNLVGAPTHRDNIKDLLYKRPWSTCRRSLNATSGVLLYQKDIRKKVMKMRTWSER